MSSFIVRLKRSDCDLMVVQRFFLLLLVSVRALMLTVELVDFGQVGEDAGQFLRVQHAPHLLEEDLVQDPEGA